MHLNLFSYFSASSARSEKVAEPKKFTTLKELLAPALKILTRSPPAEQEPLVRLTESEKQELLSHSVLNTKQFKTRITCKEHLSALLGQILADVLAKGTSLEHLPAFEGAKAWFELVNEIEQIPEEVKSAFRQYAEITLTFSNMGENFFAESKKIAQQVYQLKIGESFLLEGGRKRKSSDCPIVYEFIRASNDHFDLFVYLSGNEKIGAYYEQLVDERKTWSRPIIHYKEIPAESHLFFGRDHEIKADFFQAILETRFSTRKISAEFSSFLLLGHLQEFRYDQEPFIAERRGLTASWSCLKPFLIRKLGKQTYKKVILEIKLNALIQGYRLAKASLAKESKESEKLRIVLRRGARVILKNLASYPNMGIEIAPQLFIEARATALDLIEEIEKIEKKILQDRKVTVTQLSIPSIDKVFSQETNRKVLENAKKNVVAPRIEKGSVHTTRARLTDLPSPQEFPDVFHDYVRVYQETSIARPIKLAEIEHLVTLMPIPNHDPHSYWNAIAAEKYLPLLEDLENMLDSYRKTLYEQRVGITAKEANVAYTLYALIHHLSLAQDKIVQPKIDASHPASLAHYPLYFPGMEADQDPYLLFTSPQDYARREELIAYFKGTYTHTEAYNSKALFKVEGHYFDDFYKPEGIVAYLHALIGDSRFENELTAEVLCERQHPLQKISIGLSSTNIKKALLIEKLVNCLNKRQNLYGKRQIWVEKGLSHLLHLASAVIISYQFAKHSISYVPQIESRCYLFSKLLGVPTSFSSRIDYEDTISRRKTSKALHSVLRKDQKALFKQRFMKRNKSSNTALEEAAVLRDTQGAQEDRSDPITFLRSSCEPSLFPFKLFSYYRNKFTLFTSFQEQELFELALFRSAALQPRNDHAESRLPNAYYRKSFFPLANALQQKSFQEFAERFIQEGIDRFFFKQPNQIPRVLEATFFIRLACRLCRFAPEAHFIASLDLIEKMLATASIKAEEKSLLALHQILAYSSFQRELTQEEVEKVFGAWVFYKNTPLKEEWRNPLLDREVETFIHQISALLVENQNDSFYRSILKSALNQLGITGSDVLEISHTEHLIEGRGSDSVVWKINLLTAEVMSADGILKYTQAPQNLQDATFNYIFGQINPSYFQTQGSYYFAHPKLGTCRAIKGEDDRFHIQKLLDNVWYQYIPPETHLQSIPRFLCGNNTHWINIDPYRDDMIILDRDSGRIVARILPTGLIQTEDKKQHWGMGGTAENFLKNFERPEYLLWTVNEQGKKTVSFWRYESQAQSMLSFEEENGSLVFTANKKYILSPQQKLGLLGAKNGSLVLIHQESGAEKVLVPLQQLKKHTPLSTRHKIDVEDKHIPYGARGEFYAHQKKRFHFLEFDVKQGALVPLTQEGTFYLTYHYLAQRRYEEAFYWLKQVDFRDPISSQSQELLKNTIQIACSTDQSPEAAAVALHVWVLFKKAARRMQSEEKPFSSPPYPYPIRSIYSRFEHQIPETLLLDAEDQKLCGIELGDTKQMRTYPEIQKFKPAPHRPQYTIVPLKIEYADILFNPINTSPVPGHVKYNWDYLVKEAKRLVYEETKFIPLAPTPSCFGQPSFMIADWTLEFEQSFFTTAYEIAREKLGTEIDRKLCAFKLQTIAEVSHERPQCWEYLQLALKYPSEVPDLPEPKDYKQRLDFVNACADLAAQKGEESDFFLKSVWRDHTASEPQRPILAPILPARKAELANRNLDLSSFSKKAVDQGVTKKLFHSFFTDKEKVELPAIAAPTLSKASSLEEQEMWKTICEEFKEFETDYQEGAKINQSRQYYHLHDPSNLKTELEKEIEELNSQIADLEASILELSNKHHPDQLKTLLYIEAKIEKELSLKKLVDLFFKGDAEAFAKANPYLKNKQLVEKLAQAYNLEAHPNLVIDYLYNQIGLYMTLFVNRARLQRAAKLCAEIQPLVLTDLKRDSLVQKLAEELKPLDQPVYSIKDYPAFLVFEYLSGVSIRPQQATLLAQLLEAKEGKYINRVIQLIMGGGKTSVIAVILLKLAAQKNRLSVFVTPSSQYASVSYNLRKTLRECFGIDMEEMEVTREQLSRTEGMCGEVLKRFQTTIEEGNFLLIKSETLQAIGLEFLDFLYQAVKNPDPQLIEKINILKDVLILLREQGDGLFDEIDLLLNVLQEVNFPVGQAEFIQPERIELIRELFLLFSQEKAHVSEKEIVNLKELIGLRSNRQNLISPDTWTTTVAKAVSYHLSQTVTSLKLQGQPDFCSSFERYINGTMSINCQRVLDGSSKDSVLITETDQCDYQFLVYVRHLRHSKDPSEQEAAHQIALVKRMMQSILPVTFEKKGKRNYGRGGSKPGEVRPYLAVDTPSDNLFGYHWEAVAYHFQTALQCGISKEQMLNTAKVYKEQAVIELEKEAEGEKKVFDTTIAAIEFKNLTSVALHELEEPAKVDQAIEYLNQNIEGLLRFEAETAAEYVSYYPKRLTSTGQSLVQMLCTVRAMSGTPWNTPCYPVSLSTNFEPSVGTEGQIAQMLLSRAALKKKDKTDACVVHSQEISEILKEILDQHPQKTLVRILMDTGALFKNYSNYEVAKAIRDYLGMPVLFFMRNPLKGEKTPDTLAVLKVGSDHAEMIGGTRLEDIQKTGLNIEDYFVYDDERHTTGTDIPLIPNAVGLVTMDETMLRRSLFQSIMRARDFFLNQDVTFVIPKYLLNILQRVAPEKNAQEGVDLLLTSLILSIKNQAIAKAKHYYRSCKQKIDNVFKQNLLDDFLIKKPLTHAFIAQHFPAYEATIITVQEDKPYDQFGALEYAVESINSLKSYRKRKLKHFSKTHPKRKTIEEQTKAIVVEAQKSSYLPAKVMDGSNEGIGTEVDVLTEVAAQVNQEVEQEIEQEVLEELQLYQGIQIGSLRTEDHWTFEQITLFIHKIKDSGTDPSLKKLGTLLSEEHFPYQKDYSQVFSAPILVTNSWILSTNKHLPIFHKMQRPLDQLFVVQRGDGYQAIGLSQKEAKEFKKFLEKKRDLEILKHVWLIQSDGSLLQDTAAGNLPFNEPSIQKILVECNVFNGRVDYLDIHEQPSQAWLNASQDQVQIKKHFLKLKVAHHPLQRKLFFRSDLFGYASMQDKRRQLGVQLKAQEIDALSEKEIQALTEKDAQKLKWFSAHKLNMLKPHQVCLLKENQIAYLVKAELIQSIPQKYAQYMQPGQLKNISSEQVIWFKESVAKTQAILSELCKYMDDEQLKYLSPLQVSKIMDKPTLERIGKVHPELLAHVSGEQVKQQLIDEKLVGYLRKKEAIEQLPVDLLPKVNQSLRQKYLTRSQVKEMDREKHQVLIQDLTDKQKQWLAPERIEPGSTQEPIQASTAGIQDLAASGDKQKRETQLSITQIVLTLLASIVATGVMLLGSFALIGALWHQAPQFTIIISQALQHPLVMSSTLAGGGTLFLVGLISYAIHTCRQNRNPKRL